MCKLEDFVDMSEDAKQWLRDHPEAETQVWEEVYRQFMAMDIKPAAKVVDEWNKVPLINPVTPQELEKAILYAEKRYF